MQIADQLQQQIASGQLLPGSILPTELKLQQTFQVSRVTIRKALSLLVEQDLLYRVRGSGTYVKAQQARHDASKLKGFNEEVAAQGKTPGTNLIRFELRQSDETVARHLGLKPNAEVYAISRLRLIDGEPEILEKTYMPVTLFPDLTVEVMKQSKYHYVEKTKHLIVSKSRQRVMPQLPSQEVAELLNISSQQPVLKVISVGELETGCPFEYTVHYFRLHQYSFEFIAQRGHE